MWIRRDHSNMGCYSQCDFEAYDEETINGQDIT